MKKSEIINPMKKSTDYKRVKQSLKETEERRRTQAPKVYQLKLQNLKELDIECIQ